MNAADRLKSFLDGIETYINARNISPTPFNPEFAIAETFNVEMLEKLTQDECFNYAFQLQQYADHVGSERAKTETVIRWCDNALQSIISDAINSGVWDQYARYETKVATILRGDELASKINEWKMAAEGRLEHIKHREYNIRKKSDILHEKGKRK